MSVIHKKLDHGKVFQRLVDTSKELHSEVFPTEHHLSTTATDWPYTMQMISHVHYHLTDWARGNGGLFKGMAGSLQLLTRLQSNTKKATDFTCPLPP